MTADRPIKIHSAETSDTASTLALVAEAYSFGKSAHPIAFNHSQDNESGTLKKNLGALDFSNYPEPGIDSPISGSAPKGSATRPIDLKIPTPSHPAGSIIFAADGYSNLDETQWERRDVHSIDDENQHLVSHRFPDDKSAQQAALRYLENSERMRPYSSDQQRQADIATLEAYDKAHGIAEPSTTDLLDQLADKLRGKQEGRHNKDHRN